MYFTQWLEQKNTSPMTNQPMGPTLLDAVQARSVVRTVAEWAGVRGQKLRQWSKIKMAWAQLGVSYSACREAIQKDVRIIAHVPKELCTPELCKLAVEKDGWELSICPRCTPVRPDRIVPKSCARLHLKLILMHSITSGNTAH